MAFVQAIRFVWLVYEQRFGPTTFFEREWQKFAKGPPKATDTVPDRAAVLTPEEAAEARAEKARLQEEQKAREARKKGTATATPNVAV